MIQFVVALACEAKPLIAAFRLKRDHSVHAFPVYYNEVTQTGLVVSGCGCIPAAAATGFMGGRYADAGSAWLNVGVGGHASQTPGNVIMAHQIMHAADGRRYYPFVDPADKQYGATVMTVQQPDFNYAHDAVYDMEAAGFFAASHRLATLELIRCMKIISDNSEQDARGLKPTDVSELIANQLAAIQLVSENLRELQSELSFCQSLPQQWLNWKSNLRMTLAQENLLRIKLKQFGALNDMAYLDQIEISSFADVKALLTCLQGRLDQLTAM